MSIGLYIHLPFCVKKCPYCGFYSIAKAKDDIIAQYLQALLLELRSFDYPELSLRATQVDSIYIGGGTPSYLGMRLPSFIEAMLPLIRYNSGAEFTVEMNPESVSAELCRALAELPISRISMGVQSLDNDTLRLLGRAHSAEQARQAYELLRCFTKAAINLDLIYDIPQIPHTNMASSLQELIKLAPEHISAYSYSPDTGYLATEPSHDPYQMEMVTDTLQAAGYIRY
ncbi:MAG: radical SAM protein, partial [Deferribacteraceae bacterium]|nr:radical SAM protein [Deferribacteraceae bacterium]